MGEIGCNYPKYKIFLYALVSKIICYGSILESLKMKFWVARNKKVFSIIDEITKLECGNLSNGTN